MDIVRQSLAITFVFALLWLALWLLRRRGALGIRFSQARQDQCLLESRAKLALSAQHAVHLVRVGTRDLVVAVHPSGVTLLCDLTAGVAGHEPGGNA